MKQEGVEPPLARFYIRRKGAGAPGRPAAGCRTRWEVVDRLTGQVLSEHLLASQAFAERERLAGVAMAEAWECPVCAAFRPPRPD